MLVQFEDYDLYRGMNFKKMLKAPTDFCFGLRVSYQIKEKLFIMNLFLAQTRTNGSRS